MVRESVNLLELLRKQAAGGDLDFLREAVAVLAEAVMEAEVAEQAGAAYGERSPERITRRNGYRPRRWDTRAGSIELQIPKLRQGSYFPALLEPRRRAERALLAVVQQAYVEGVSTRRVDDLVRSLGCEGISKSQVSRICAELDSVVTSFLERPLDGGPYRYLWLDALTQRVREEGRIAQVSVVVEPAVAYRPLDRALPLASILSFRHPRSVARDNTVKYRWRTLQLLPGPERTSYAGTQVEVLERPGGELSVLHQGETIPSREAPPRAGVLRAARSELARNPNHERIASGLGSGGAPRRLPVAPAVPAAEGAPNGAAVKPEPGSKELRPPTPRQLARWKAIQQAQLQGLSMRATARLLGISRDTVSSYVRANGVPGRQTGAAASSDGDGGTDKVAALLH